MNIKQGNAIELIKEIKDLSVDIIMSDPPYQLGSKLETKNYTEQILKAIKENIVDDSIIHLIENNNKLDVKGSGKDFMNKWDAIKGSEWESLFKDAFRVLKYGGFCIFYGLEEAGALYNYYASMAGFEISQSIYYFYSQSFPKNLNFSKAVDSKLGIERKVVGIDKLKQARACKNKFDQFTSVNPTSKGINSKEFNEKIGIVDVSTSTIGKKYTGYHAGIKPLKSNTEIIYVFHKPCKYKSYIDDLMAYENGEKDIHVSAWWIDGNRIEYKENDHVMKYGGYSDNSYKSDYDNGSSYKHGNQVQINTAGRYPSQILFDPSMAERLDDQSGVLKSGDNCIRTKTGNGYHGNFNGIGNEQVSYGDSGGASRFFSVIPYLDDSKEKFIYSQKVSKFEREAGLENFDNKERFGAGNYSTSPKCSICGLTQNGTNDHSECIRNPEYKLVYERTEENSVQKNNHATLKNLLLNKKIFDLCKTPNRENETLLIPFGGVFSEVIGAIASGFIEENVTVFELQNSEEHPFIDIGKARYKFWKGNNFAFAIEDKKVLNKVKSDIKKKKESIDKQEEKEYDDLLSM